MQTRSHTKKHDQIGFISNNDATDTYHENIIKQILDKPSTKLSYSVDIDFDEASREWSANKKRVGQMYLYVCGTKLSSGKRCQNKPSDNLDRCCKKHTDNQFDPNALVNFHISY